MTKTTNAVSTSTKGAKGATKSAPVAAAAPAIKFIINAYKRPQRGHALWAHTAAFLTLSGMADGKAFPQSLAIKVIGETAVKYHKGNGNFEHTADGLTLTAQGYESFILRATDPEMLAGFTATLSQGTPYPAQRVDTKDLIAF